VLEPVDGQLHRLRPSTSSSSQWGEPGNISASAAPLARIIALASRTTGKIVMDETGIGGRYDFELKWDVREPDSFAQAVQSQLGLRLSSKRRFINHLLIDSMIVPSVW
jgi:uncharacterized protein (TIGR03435 family)